MTIIAKRDMTRVEFQRALANRGWKQVLAWIDVGNGHSIGMVMIKGRRGWKTNYRASLAHASRQVARIADGVAR